MTNTDNRQVTMPNDEGRELTLEQWVAQSTLCHPDWHELDHMSYLVSEVGFEAEYVRDRLGDVIHQMVTTRGAMDARPELPWPNC